MKAIIDESQSFPADLFQSELICHHLQCCCMHAEKLACVSRVVSPEESPLPNSVNFQRNI